MIRKAEWKDTQSLGKLASALWPHHTPEEMATEMAAILEQEDAAVFLQWEDGIPVGFAQCSLRRDYVEGTESSPVGYLEGIYVAEGYRGQGYARQLVAVCENWAKENGCTEFASDCELENMKSLHFHLSVGFEEANRIICFTKKL